MPGGWLAVCAVISAVAVGMVGATPGQAGDAINWVSVGKDGRLAYGSDGQGNRVPDFSTAGYRAGSAIPEVRAARKVQAPSGGDDTALIQAALDALSQNPVDDAGLRGAVELGPGNFIIGASLRISASGMVLRGAGVGKTVLHTAGELEPVLVIGGTGAWKRKGEILHIDEDYVPVGATSLRVKGGGGLKVGDRIIVQRPFTREWISAIGMDRIPVRANGGKVKQWEPGPGVLFDRTVVAVAGDRIELNAPVTNALSSADGPRIWRYEFEGRISNVGVEQLSVSGDGAAAAPAGRIHPVRSTFAVFNAVEDSWIRDVSIEGYTTAIEFRRTASRISAQRMKIGASPKIKRHGALPTAVLIDGQNILVADCELTGGSYIAWATQSFAPGPNVVHNCKATGDRVTAHAHQRWATGLLFDNVNVAGSMQIGNRGNMGTGQGWAGANSVLWNSSATTWIVENPPTAHNWAFGMRGRLVQSKEPLGEIVSPGREVNPSSLFGQQLRDRTGRGIGQTR
jgi:hypothetical protein